MNRGGMSGVKETVEMKTIKDIFRSIAARGGRRNPVMEGIRDGTKAFCGPERVYIDLTNTCSLNCIACWHRSPLLSREDVLPHWDTGYELPTDRVVSLIDEVASLGAKKIMFSGGGDPLLHKDIFKILGHTSSRGLEILLVSNFTAAGEDTMRRIIESGVTQILVNLWAGSPGAYISTHPGTSEKTYSRLLHMLRVFASSRKGSFKPELVISNVVMRHNYGEIENMVRLAIEIGASDVWFTLVDAESGKLRHLLLDPQQIGEVIKALGTIERDYASRLADYQKRILKNDDFLEKLTNSRAAEGIYHSDVIDTIPCYTGWTECRILANGDVVPCCKADKHPLGSILRGSFREVWFSEPFNEFRRKAKASSKTDPYFRRIHCAKVCDNWEYNKDTHRRYAEYEGHIGK